MWGLVWVWVYWYDRWVIVFCYFYVRYGWGYWVRIGVVRIWRVIGWRGWGWRGDEEIGWRRRWGRVWVEVGRFWWVVVLLLLIWWCWLVYLLLFWWCRYELLLIFGWSYKLLLVISRGYELLLGVRCWYVFCYRWCLV